MTDPDRIPCLRHRHGCRRTAPRAKYDDPDTEIICGKCWRTFVPPRLKHREKLLKAKWRHERRLQRRRGSDPMVLWRLERLQKMNWRAIRRAITILTKPAGLDAFLKESGL